MNFFRKRYNHPLIDEVEHGGAGIEEAQTLAAAFWQRKTISLKDIAFNFASPYSSDYDRLKWKPRNNDSRLSQEERFSDDYLFAAFATSYYYPENEFVDGADVHIIAGIDVNTNDKDEKKAAKDFLKNAWGVTDHYNADRALSLIRGLDYTAKCSPGHKLLTNIDWDDGDDPSDPDDPMFAQPTLPTEVEVEESMYGDEIADYLSDTFGYLVNGWIERKNGWKQNV